jgi:TonB family protein
MRANSPSAFFTSLALHGLVVAVIAFFTLYMAHKESTPPVIFELVAGPPTAPDELVAPALGNTTKSVKLNVPKVELQPEPTPEPQVVETVKTEAMPPVRKTAKEGVAPPPKATKSDTSIAKAVKKSERMSYQEYLKKHPTPKTAPKGTAQARTGGKVPRIDVQGIVGGVRGGSAANTRGGGGGKALTREEMDELSTYISFLLSRLKEAHEPPPGVSDRLEAKVTFDITAGGTILNPRISKSSGDAAFDESVIDAFRRIGNLGPPPNGRSDTWTVTFRMKDET